MNLNKWYEKGKAPEAYEETLTNHKEAFEHIYKTLKLPEDAAFLKELAEKNIRILILAEPWCAHCMLNIPILLRIAEHAEVPVRILHRDENLELMDQHLTNEKPRSIPIFLILNEAGDLIGKWGPVANTTKQFVDPYKEKLPAKDDPYYEKSFKYFASTVSEEFRNREHLWQGVYESIKQTLQSI